MSFSRVRPLHYSPIIYHYQFADSFRHYASCIMVEVSPKRKAGKKAALLASSKAVAGSVQEPEHSLSIIKMPSGWNASPSGLWMKDLTNGGSIVNFSKAFIGKKNGIVTCPIGWKGSKLAVLRVSLPKIPPSVLEFDVSDSSVTVSTMRYSRKFQLNYQWSCSVDCANGGSDFIGNVLLIAVPIVDGPGATSAKPATGKRARGEDKKSTKAKRARTSVGEDSGADGDVSESVDAPSTSKAGKKTPMKVVKKKKNVKTAAKKSEIEAEQDDGKDSKDSKESGALVVAATKKGVKKGAKKAATKKTGEMGVAEGGVRKTKKGKIAEGFDVQALLDSAVDKIETGVSTQWKRDATRAAARETVEVEKESRVAARAAREAAKIEALEKERAAKRADKKAAKRKAVAPPAEKEGKAAKGKRRKSS